MYQVLGVEHVRHRRPAAPEVVLRRLPALDYLLERPRTSWLPTEAEKVDALTAARIARGVLPRRLYQGALGGQYRYFPHKLPVALDTWRATFVFALPRRPAGAVAPGEVVLPGSRVSAARASCADRSAGER
ncbi:MAG: hypothetical protein OXH75_24685 [Acidobacteria bacterium]|nr:hypothetical protein [Acidobacteriota bacterium]